MDDLSVGAFPISDERSKPVLSAIAVSCASKLVNETWRNLEYLWYRAFVWLKVSCPAIDGGSAFEFGPLLSDRLSTNEPACGHDHGE